MKKIKFIVEKTNDGYSAYADKYDVYTVGSDGDELLKNILEATNLHFKEIKEKRTVDKDDIQLSYSIGSFFEIFPINVKQFSKRVGINYTLLAQYIQGKKKPSDKQTEKIVEGLRDVGRDLLQAKLK